MFSPPSRVSRVFESKIDKFLRRYPPIGRLLAFLASSIEVAMLEVFRRIGKVINKPIHEYVFRNIYRGRWGGRIVPLNRNIDVETRFLPSQEILEIVSRSSVAGIAECYCRHTYKNCDNPTNTCIHLSFGQSLQQITYKSENLRKVSKEKIVNLLEDCDKRGLVHTLIFFPNPEFYYVVCNCCPCCCAMLSRFLKSGSPQVIKSDFIARTNQSKCENCGECKRWCYFGARKLIDNKLSFYPNLCFGCGICASKCPQNAISLVKKEE
jgi:Pyruvate/2-oxoacid:ferredoxin oxidoreductase delta subunit